ncbi:MAG TPA: TRAP transporter substrate-binding protein DctP [Candidatus Eisenbacteria bacterium]|jgi:TRAP-type C4-dicarboxylate transport system substrate-binding protein
MNRARGVLLALLATAALVASAADAGAQTNVVRLASLVPDGSVWHKVLQGTGAEWAAATGGRVTLRIYPGGVAGDEPDMVRKMRIGQIQASALTVMGLASIDDSFMVFGIPMVFDSYGELLYVLSRMRPVLTQRLEAKGFVLLNWGHAGWVHFFTKQPVQSATEIRRLKMFVWAGDDRMVQMWRENGFQPVALAATDILTGLQTGMIEAYPTTPLAALSLQWFRSTPYMVESGLAPLVGAMVITKQAWAKISEPDRAAILAACKKAEQRLEHDIPGQDSMAVVEMQKRGLTVTQLKPAAMADWEATANAFAARMRGSMVPADILDLALRERDAYRKQAAR